MPYIPKKPISILTVTNLRKGVFKIGRRAKRASAYSLGCTTYDSSVLEISITDTICMREFD